MARLVVVAFVVVVFVKMLPAVQVLAEYSFGIVDEESMKYIAEVVDHERPTEVKYVALVVLKKLRASFHASFEVVENARPTEVKYVDEVVEKKLFTFFQKSVEVVEKKNPLSMLERKLEEREVVATTEPCALVERSAFAMLVMARLVVVAPFCPMEKTVELEFVTASKSEPVPQVVSLL